jgi:fucose 4-O-acetylase-like acetyltransferase
MVILRHSFAPYIGAWDLTLNFQQSYPVSIFGKYVSSISMPLYVFISGVLFSFLRNKLNKYETFNILLKKKTKRLIIPYIFFAPIYIFFFSNYISIGDFLVHFWKGAGHLWFLTMIFIVFLVFYIFESVFKKHPFKSFIIVLAVFSLFPIYNYLRLGPIAQAFYYFPFFYFGYFFYYKGIELLYLLESKKYLLILVHTILFTTTIIVENQINNSMYKSIFGAFMKLPLGLLSVSFLFIFFSNINKSNNRKFNLLINNISDKSYYIYIFHQPLMILGFGLPMLVKWPPYIVILTSFIGALLSSLILSNITMRYKVGKRLIGA